MWSAYWKLHFYCIASSIGEAVALFMCQMKTGVNIRMENAVVDVNDLIYTTKTDYNLD